MNERPPPRKVSGAALTQISTDLDQLHRRHFGKGPSTTTTYAEGDVLYCKMGDAFTSVEHRMLARGLEEQVLYMRRMAQVATDAAYQQVVEDATGRKVDAHMSATHTLTGLAVELFVLA